MDKETIFSIITMIISILAIIIPVAIYFKQRNQDREIYDDNKQSVSKKNVNDIVTEYFKLSDASISNGISGLIRAGIANLQNEDEARKVIKIISNQTKKNPLSNYQNIIEQIGILTFFKNIDLKQFKNGKIDEIINHLLHNN